MSEPILHHAYIIEAPFNVDKIRIVKDMIKSLACENHVEGGCSSCIQCRKIEDLNHIDIVHIYGDKKNKDSGKKSVRNEHIIRLINDLKKAPLDGEYHFAIIEDSDYMSVEGANRLLKTLEEPPERTVIFLLSENTESLTETIKSRCIVCRYFENDRNINQQSFKLTKQLYDTVIKKEELYKAFSIIDKVGKEREEAYKLIDALEQMFRDMIFEGEDSNLLKKKIFSIIDACEECRRDIKENISVPYGLKKLVIKIRR